jgi:hypothetical protein
MAVMAQVLSILSNVKVRIIRIRGLAEMLKQWDCQRGVKDKGLLLSWT